MLNRHDELIWGITRMEYIEVSAKTVEDAISEAAIKLEVPSR